MNNQIPSTDLAAYANFEAASTDVLNYLHALLGFDLWMVTRKESNNWIVLESLDHGYKVKKGDLFRWTDSFCSRMIEGLGPRIAPNAMEIEAYTQAPIGQQVTINAYIGVPMTLANGELFGTLCAIDPQPMPESIKHHLPLIELFSKLLTTILEYELLAQNEHRRAERASEDAMIDPLTGIYNRRGWEHFLSKENIRCQRYSNPAAIISLDLDNLKNINDRFGHSVGDKLLLKTVECLQLTFRECDILSRLGGDEFGVLILDCKAEQADSLAEKLAQNLKSADVAATIGVANWKLPEELSETFEAADQQMNQNKQTRRR